MNNSIIVSNGDIAIDENLQDSSFITDNESLSSLISSPILEEGIFIEINSLNLEQFIKENSPQD